MIETISSRTKKNEFPILFISAIGITLFLFFVDEGYYNFNWMKNIGNWIVFIPYVIIIFSTQALFYSIILKKYKKVGKVVISAIAGPIILALIFTVFIKLFS